MVYPLHGADRDGLRDTLREQWAKVSNLRSPSPGWTTHHWLIAYIEWANTAASALRGRVSQTDIDRLVWTERHRYLASKVDLLPSRPLVISPGLNHSLSAELDDRTTVFHAALQVLDERITAWSVPGTFVVLDTSVYIQGAKLEETDLAALLGLDDPDDSIRLLVPMAVVDELDSLKQSGKGHVRWRAAYTTAVLYRVLHAAPGKPALLHKDNAAVTVELLPDPSGHVRLPIPDDEIVDRAATAQGLAGRTITLVTYDTGQALRAGLAGLNPLRLQPAVEREPEPK